MLGDRACRLAKKGDPGCYYYTFCEAGSKGIFCYWVVGMT